MWTESYKCSLVGKKKSKVLRVLLNNRVLNIRIVNIYEMISKTWICFVWWLLVVLKKKKQNILLSHFDMTTQQCCEQTFNIVTYTNHNKVKSFDITPIPTAYTHILNLLSPHTLILKDKENNIHKYDMYKDIYLPLCNTPMFPNSSHTLLHTIPILGGVKNDTLIYVFSKTDSNIENLLFIHHVCTANIPTTWVILSGSIENSRLYIVVAHTLVSQTPQICTYSIQLNDTNATFVRFQDTDIVKEYTIVSSTVWDVDGSRFRWWCCGKIASSENIL